MQLELFVVKYSISLDRGQMIRNHVVCAVGPLAAQRQFERKWPNHNIVSVRSYQKGV